MTEHDHSIQESGGLDSINIAAKPKGGRGEMKLHPSDDRLFPHCDSNFEKGGCASPLPLAAEVAASQQARFQGRGSLGSFENASRRQGCVAPADSIIQG